MYCTEYISKHNSNPKKVWQIINSLIPRKAVNSFVKNINVDNKFIYQPSDRAKEFNKYFVKIGNSLGKNMENQNNTTYTAYLKTVLNSIVLEPPTANEIFYMLLSTNLSKACGYDNISNFFYV